MLASKSADVGNKMRDAVKAKLMELGCYVDDELPDYIMVMIANKRSATEMSSELRLFLENKTDNFVSWLHQILKKLRKVTVNNTDIITETLNSLKQRMKGEMLTKSELQNIKKEIKKEKIKSETIKKDGQPREEIKETIIVEDIVLNHDPLSLSLSTICNTNSNDEFDIPSLAEVQKIDVNHKQVLQRSEVGATKRHAEDDDQVRPKPVKHARITFDSKDFKDKMDKNGSSRSKSSPTDRRSGLKSAIVNVVRHNARLDKPTVSSVIQVRKSRPSKLNIGAQKTLLFKAIEDAQKSIIEKDSKKEFEEILTVINKPRELFTKSYKERILKEKIQGESKQLKNILVTVGQTDVSDYDVNHQDNDSCGLGVSDGEVHNEVSSTTNNFDSKTNGLLSEDPKFNTLDNSKNDTSSIVIRDEDNCSTMPLFKKNEIRTLSVSVKEKCKYWPNCRNNTQCVFIHPSVKCQSFPLCKYGDRCIYIHPECKFGFNCMKINCPFWHSNAAKVIKSQPNMCKYSTNCANPKCAFFHPNIY